MRGRGWIPIGGIYCTESMQESLDKHLKAFLQRAISVWVAVVLEKVGVITIDRMLNARIKLHPGMVGAGKHRIIRSACFS